MNPPLLRPPTLRRRPGGAATPGALARPLLLALAVVVQGCGGDGSAEASGRRPLELEGAPLLVGSSLDQWSLVGIPRDGGTVRVHSAGDPGRLVEEGGTSLPASRDVRVVGERHLFLRTGEGTVLQYDPEADELTRTGTVGGEPAFSTWNGYGVYAPTEGGALLEVGNRDAWTFDVAGRPVWAAPAEDGRVAVLLEPSEGGRSLWLLRRGDEEPERRASVTYAPPGLATAFGRRLVFRSSDGRGLRFVAVPSLTEGPEVAVGGRVTALAASPSSHAIYAALEEPSRVVAVNRFSREVRELGRIDGSIESLRGSILGQAVLAHDGRRVWWLDVGGGEPAAVEGEWRADLPAVLPDGRVLLAREGGLFLWDPEAGSAPALLPDLPASHAWGLVRWNPAPDRIVSDRAAASGAADDEAGAGRVAAQPETTPPGGREAGAAAEPTPEAADSARVPAGFYAVAGSARDPGGVRDLLDELGSGGYPTTLQRHRDDADRTWYRALVGPYPTRREAEAAARQLRRERDLAAWVAELGREAS